MSTIDIQLNGQQKSVGSETVEELLSELELGGKRVAVELNQEIVSRDSYRTTKLSSGDSVEVVHFVGGG